MVRLTLTMPSDSRGRNLLVKREKIYYVYILASRSRNLYTGVTSNLQRRVWEHKQGLVEAFTRKYRIHRLVHFESFTDVRDAVGREKQVKARRRAKRVALVGRYNPTWHDLSAGWYEKDGSEKADPSPPRLARARDDRKASDRAPGKASVSTKRVQRGISHES